MFLISQGFELREKKKKGSDTPTHRQVRYVHTLYVKWSFVWIAYMCFGWQNRSKNAYRHRIIILCERNHLHSFTFIFFCSAFVLRVPSNGFHQQYNIPKGDVIVFTVHLSFFHFSFSCKTCIFNSPLCYLFTCCVNTNECFFSAGCFVCLGCTIHSWMVEPAISKHGREYALNSFWCSMCCSVLFFVFNISYIFRNLSTHCQWTW